MQNPQTIDPSTVKVNLAAAESEAQYVNQEQVMAAALFAKQLRADLNGIRSASVGEGLRVPDIDVSKVMPSEIFKTFRPAGLPAGMPPPAAVQQPVAVPTVPLIQPQVQMVQPVLKIPQPPAGAVNLPYVEPATPKPDNSQLEFDFNKTARYEDVVEAIEKLDKKINILVAKVDEMSLAYIAIGDDKKKLKKKTPDGTQIG